MDNSGLGQCTKIGSVCAKRKCSAGKKCVDADGIPTCIAIADRCSPAKARLCDARGKDCEIHPDGSQNCIKRPDPCDDHTCTGFSRCESVGRLVHCRPSRCNKVTVEMVDTSRSTDASISNDVEMVEVSFAEFCASDEGGKQVCGVDATGGPVCQKPNPCTNRWCPEGYVCSPNLDTGTAQCILEDACARYHFPGYTMHALCKVAGTECSLDKSNTPKCVASSTETSTFPTAAVTSTLPTSSSTTTTTTTSSSPIMTTTTPAPAATEAASRPECASIRCAGFQPTGQACTNGVLGIRAGECCTACLCEDTYLYDWDQDRCIRLRDFFDEAISSTPAAKMPHTVALSTPQPKVISTTVPATSTAAPITSTAAPITTAAQEQQTVGKTDFVGCDDSYMNELCASRGKVCIINKQGSAACRTLSTAATSVLSAAANNGDVNLNREAVDMCENSGMDKICLKRGKICTSSKGEPVCRVEKKGNTGESDEAEAAQKLTCSEANVAKCNAKGKVCFFVEGGLQRCRNPSAATDATTTTTQATPAPVGCAIDNMDQKCVSRGKVCFVLESGIPVCKFATTTSTTVASTSTQDPRCDGACWGTQTCTITLGGSPKCVEQTDSCLANREMEMCAKRGKACQTSAGTGVAECVKASACDERTCDPGFMCVQGEKKQDTICIPVDLCDRGAPTMRSTCARKKKGCKVTANGGTECTVVKECSVHNCSNGRECHMAGPKNAEYPVCLPWNKYVTEETPYEDARPHIIMFLTDDQGYANVGFKNRNISTPHIDALVRKGVVLNRHYGASWCAPSRAALMSGRMPLRVDHKAVHPGIALLPEVLSAAGYRTAQVGKWHIGKCSKDMTPFERGFTESFGNLGQVLHDLTVEKYCFMAGCEGGVDLWDTAEPAYGKGNEGEYSSYVYSSYIRKYIKNHNSSTPLFMYINPTQPHTPYVVPDEYSQPYLDAGSSASFAIYNGMITAVDDIVGATVNSLKSQRMWRNTLFIYASDNGGLTCAADYEAGFASNYPLRGGKLSVLEGGVRSLAFVSGGYLPPSTRGSERNGYVHLADWYPTIGRLAGAPQESDPWGYSTAGIPSIDGYDVWNYVSGREDESPRKEILFADWRAPGKVTRKAALIQGDLKFVSSNGLIKFGYVSCAGWTDLGESGQASVADLSVCKKPAPEVGTGWKDDDEHADEIADELEAEGTLGGDALHHSVCSSGNPEEDLDCTDGCIFNITADPGERYDISALHPELTAEMHDRVVSLQRSTGTLDVVRRTPDDLSRNCVQTTVGNIKSGYLQPFYEHTPFYIRRVGGTPGLPNPFDLPISTSTSQVVLEEPEHTGGNGSVAAGGEGGGEGSGEGLEDASREQKEYYGNPPPRPIQAYGP